MPNDFLMDEYQYACKNTETDIYEHLPVLYNFAFNCKSVTEFGVRDGQSTRAFLAIPHGSLRSYDLYIDPYVQGFFEMANEEGKDAKYILGDSLKIEIEKTDLLFIDTDHTYKQLSQELKLHSSKVRKYIIMHDTDLPYGQELLAAIMEFLAEYRRDWYVIYHTRECHGLTILERK